MRTDAIQFSGVGRFQGGWLSSSRKERKVEFTSGIALARLGPILVKYLQNLVAISTGSVIILPSDLNDECKGDLL